tara:strand:+ start:2864 stop:3592 length:729 start_codon:yes stop_codon:yes gene_type:complete
MKFFLCYTLLFFSANVFSQQLSGKVTYVVSMSPISDKKIDSLLSKRKTKNPEMNDWIKNMFKEIPDIKAYLEFTKKESIYYVEEKMKVEGSPKLNLNRISAGGDNKVYKNINTREYLQEYKRENLLIEKKEKKWKITQESKKIGEYLCFKAIDIESTNTKKKPIVWFAPSIPVSFEPLDFNGLPGLVIRVEMAGGRTLSASKIELNLKEKIEIKKPTTGKIISEKNFREYMNMLIESRMRKQ